MDLGLSGKVALVFGAGGGLGSAIAQTLASEGADVVLADINFDAAESVAASIRDNNKRARALQWDLNDLSVIDAHISQIEKELGPVDILVNNTGGPPPTPVAYQTQDVWNKHFQSMVLSVIAIADRVLPQMRARQFGRIITSSSSGVIAPIPNLGLSNALRVSLLGWSKTLSREVGKEGVTCNVVVPGRIATGRTKFLDEQKAKREGRPIEDVSDESANTIALGRYGNPQEYADVVTFLASTRASYLTGSVLRVDGGMIANI
ncbi:SDR family oxidoreductase [Advenella mimigardefordensis]|uniref:Putative oxidoreductase, SDR family n=1 Tax=Advenella mimigardefordensis (strain DSM 17166 / LMG 22922 / DPN7) TaxID=1247726 RepID=W0PFJ5_ADVMD|nr:SDR family oxidoreductase [Advenella mimigardefordensis]AHG63828.1 putative oxidoreductase, SDR family [Advenella mimigardefordensis DPN7]